MQECYKCSERNNLVRIGKLCDCCEDFESGVATYFGIEKKERSSYCSCKSICRDCYSSKCARCGNVNKKDVVADCKVCGKENMLERIDNADTDGQGNWVDYRGRVIGSCGECIDCGMKTVCRDCADSRRSSYQETPPRSWNRW